MYLLTWGRSSLISSFLPGTSYTGPVSRRGPTCKAAPSCWLPRWRCSRECRCTCSRCWGPLCSASWRGRRSCPATRWRPWAPSSGRGKFAGHREGSFPLWILIMLTKDHQNNHCKLRIAERAQRPLKIIFKNFAFLVSLKLKRVPVLFKPFSKVWPR